MSALETKRIRDILDDQPCAMCLPEQTETVDTGGTSLTGKMFEPRLSLTAPWENEEVVAEEDIGSRFGSPWKVVLYNDDVHTFDEVIVQLQKALRCGQQKAENIAFEAHTRGKAIAYAGEFEDCFRVTAILREIQLIVEIEG